MIKLINLFICFILINNYGHSKKLSLYIDDREFEKVSIDKYHQMKSKKYDYKRDHFFNSIDDLQASASSNEVDIMRSDEKQKISSKQNQRFRDWYDISEHSNQTSPEQQSIKLESNLSNLNNLIGSNNFLNKSTKKKWRLISSSTLSDTSIDDDKILIKKQKKRKSRKLKTANLELKFKQKINQTDYVKNKFVNTTVYTINKSTDKKISDRKENNENNLKFKLNDAMDFKNYESNRIKGYKPNFVSIRLNQTNSLIPLTNRSNDTLSKRTQLTGESKISKKLMLATMLPSMIKGLTHSHTHVAVLPTTAVAAQPAQIAVMPMPAPMPIPVAVQPQIHIVAAPPRPIYHHHVIRPPPAQIIAQPIIQQPIIQQPIIHQQPIVQRKIITQPVYIKQPVHIIRTIKPQPIYQMQSEQPMNCNQQQDIVDDSNEEATISDPVDDEDNTSIQQPDDSYSQESWGNQQDQQQVRIVPQQIVAQPQDSWGNQVQNQRVYAYHTASVPKTTRTVYTQTKMIPSFTTVHSTTSYTPEHKHTIVETEHNVKPVMSLVSTGHRKIVTRPVYTVKAIQQPVQAVSPTYVSSNQGSWSN